MTATGTPVGAETVEQVVRAQLSKALGGRRGMLEAAVPTLAFTILFLSTKQLELAIGVSVVIAVVLLVVRLVQRSTVQFVMNSLVGIGIGAFFAWRSAQGGGDANEQALAYFLPGMIYNGVYAVLMVFSTLVRWPVVGFMVGSVAGDPTEWHSDPQVVRLCRNLTLDAGRCRAWSGWRCSCRSTWPAGRPPTRARWSRRSGSARSRWAGRCRSRRSPGMAWLLARNHTPVEPEPETA